MKRHYEPADACEVVRCWAESTFTVEHPQRGELDVCDYHARQMADAFDGLEVTL